MSGAAEDARRLKPRAKSAKPGLRRALISLYHKEIIHVVPAPRRRGFVDVARGFEPQGERYDSSWSSQIFVRQYEFLNRSALRLPAAMASGWSSTTSRPMCRSLASARAPRFFVPALLSRLPTVREFPISTTIPRTPVVAAVLSDSGEPKWVCTAPHTRRQAVVARRGSAPG